MRFEVTTLGTNGAVPTHQRHGSAHFLSTESTDILIDCAEGTQIQMRAAGLGPGRVKLVLITHLHGDHYFGLPGLITSLSLEGRTTPLRIISPPGLRERLAPILELDRYTPPFPLLFETFTATDFSLLTEEGDLDIYAFPLWHRIVTNGYLIREKDRQPNLLKEMIERYDIPWQAIPAIKAGGDFTTAAGKIVPHAELTAPASPPRSYAYCSDTIYFPELAEYVRGVDLLYHEATFLHDRAEDARMRMHATAREAAITARDGEVKQLIMGHFSSRYADVVEHEEEAREIFSNSWSARDLYRFEVPYAGRKD